MKTIIKIYLSLAIIFSQIFIINSANAATVGGWSMSNPVAKGASTVYTGIKNVTINGADYIKKGTAIVTPTAAGVSKVLARGVAGYALSIAVEQLLGAVDWVLDPEAQLIRYYLDPSETGQYTWKLDRGGNTFKGSSASQVCQMLTTWLKSSAGYPKAVYKGVKFLNEDSKKNVYYDCLIALEGDSKVTQTGPAIGIYNVDYTAEEKTLPLEVVASKVIENAESETDQQKKAAAQTATTAAAADIVADAESDNVKAHPIVQQLENSAQTKPADEAAADKAGEATGTSKPNAETGATDLALEFPIFCDWAPTICEAAQTVISFPTTLTEWWTTGKEKAESWASSISDAWISFRDWFKSDDDLPDDEKPQISEISTPELKEDAVRWSAQCPADAQVPINMQGVSSTITFSWSPWCQLLSMIKPAIVVSAYIGAAFIVLGLRT